jgi:formylglycine-generating enzyme required for sulfatase activity
VRSFARRSSVVFSVGVVSLLTLLAVPTHAVTIDLVPVGNAGNANDPATGNLYGGVAYDYQIGTYDVTIGQYAAFLNAADPNGTNPNGIYNSSMGTDLNVAGVSYTAGAATGSKYSVMNNGGDSANRPITYVSWFDAARFANWMTNGQGSGSTETGAYDLANAPAGVAPAKTPGAAFYIPNENEWYKAAYYSATLNGGAGDYYAYATQSNTTPGNQIGSAANQANYIIGAAGGPGGMGGMGGIGGMGGMGARYSVTQDGTYSSTQNYLTDVGAFSGSGSFYGTFDQSGNVYQWNDLNGAAGTSRGYRGGSWVNDDPLGRWFLSSSSDSGAYDPSNEYVYGGFRLASPVAVPEPSTCAMSLAGLACGGYSLFRRRRVR